MAGRRRSSFVGAVCALFCGLVQPDAALADPPKNAEKPITIGRICELIEAEAEEHSLPPDFLARLIWKESRFDPNAVSPVGAEGIAQFMPGTAAMRDLADPFDIEQAIPASAAYLSELAAAYGNLGLAAAAYNAGEGRVSRWLAAGGFLPLETENYVLDIMGEPADNFVEASYRPDVPPLDPDKPFEKSCRNLPVAHASIVPMARIHVKPWGVQVAGNFNRAAAIRQYERVREQLPDVLSEYDPVVSRVRSPRGRRGIYAVRIGADTRADADAVCAQLRSAGGACMVTRNR